MSARRTFLGEDERKICVRIVVKSKDKPSDCTTNYAVRDLAMRQRGKEVLAPLFFFFLSVLLKESPFTWWSNFTK